MFLFLLVNDPACGLTHAPSETKITACVQRGNCKRKIMLVQIYKNRKWQIKKFQAGNRKECKGSKYVTLKIKEQGTKKVRPDIRVNF